MWKLHNDKLPICIKSMFTEKNNYNIPTRAASRFQLPNPKTEAKRKFITFYGLKTWNSLQPDVKNSRSIELFKRRIKLFFKSEPPI